MLSKLDQLIEWSRGLRVIYVEDDLNLQEELSILLSDIFESVDLASNGEEGLEKIAKNEYDIIITDIRMPKLNGIGMIKALKEDFDETPVMVISAHNEIEYLVDLINLGIENFLTKPLRSEQVFDALHTVVSRIYTSKELRRYKSELEDANAKLKRLVSVQAKNIDFKTAMLESYRNAIYDVALVSLTDTDGVIKEVNDKFCEAMEFSKEQIIGKKHNIFRHPNTPLQTYEKMWSTILSKKTWHGLLVNQTKSMRAVYHYTTIVPILDESGKIYEFLSVKQDLTAFQLENQKKLKDSVAKSAYLKRDEILKQIPFSAVIFDKDSKVLHFNSEFEELVEQMEDSSYYSALLSGNFSLDDSLHLEGLVSLKDTAFIDSVCENNASFNIEGLINLVDGKTNLYVKIKKLDENAYIALFIKKEDLLTCFLVQES